MSFKNQGERKIVKNMEIGSYVVVTNKDCNLFGRRCRVEKVMIDGDEKWIELYSEGLEEREIVKVTDCEKSKF